MRRLTNTKLFLDGGDPKETEEATRLLNDAGFDGLDGQTTNPSLVSKNPDIMARIKTGDKLTNQELLAKYKEIVQEVEGSAPGDISIEVYADKDTKAEMMIEQGREFGAWIDSAVIKLPIISEGLKAAAVLKDELKLNMTLCFSQQQGAAVYAATRASKHPILISPFIGRLDDKGINGMDIVANLMKMYEGSDGHVHVLTASVRNVNHILGALALKTHAMTLPFEKSFKLWAATGFNLPDEKYSYHFSGDTIEYEKLDLEKEWERFDIQHNLTDAGLQKFADDWNSLLSG